MPVHPPPLPSQQTPLQPQHPRLHAQNPLLQPTLQSAKQAPDLHNEAQSLVLQAQQPFHQGELSGVQQQLPGARNQQLVVFMYVGPLKLALSFGLTWYFDMQLGILPLQVALHYRYFARLIPAL